MDICFIGDKEKIDNEIARSEKELQQLLCDLEAESVKDLQPTDLDEEEILPDPTIYDMIRFLIKELEEDGKIDCPCHSGSYDIRFCHDGIEVFCTDCGARHVFDTRAASASEEYLSIDSLNLK
jgi:hypothetical protein